MKVKKFNERLAVRITALLGTMWCAYAFVVLCVLPLMFPAQEGTILYLSNCFQLVFLPLLMVGQNVLGRKGELRAQADHRAIMEELQEIKAMHEVVTTVHGHVQSLDCFRRPGRTRDSGR